MPGLPTLEELRTIGRRAGLDEVGISTAAPMARARRALEVRRAAGLHGGMAFTYRNPARSSDPERVLRGARALVVGARSYRRAEPPHPDDDGPQGRIGRFAWVDHYSALRDGLWAVAHRLEVDGWKARVMADDNSLVDREAAWQAGIGWYGKHANVLLPGKGSWYVLGSVVTDAPLPPAEQPVADGCGTCRRCIDSCPTGAIVADGVVDARRCLAWLVQAPGVFPAEHRVALGDRFYGCDDCQEVCPVNRTADRHDPPSGEQAAQAWVPMVELLGRSDEELLARHSRWYIADRDPTWLRRNALVVLGNVGDGSAPAVVDALRRALAADHPMLVAHAVWAAHRLGRDDLLVGVACADDEHVRAELAAAGHR